MSVSRRIPPKELRDLWAEIPKMKNCKGLCDNSCGPIGCSSVERELVEERTGKRLEAVAPAMTCSMLKNGLCTAYSVRPTLCRLWGAVEGMKCPHGCEPERMLTDAEGMDILARSMNDEDPDGMALARDLMANFGPVEWARFQSWLQERSPDLRR